jgi:hypothetical protein
VVDKLGPTLIVPQVEMTFDSEDKAYEMYNTYVGKVGFNIRKSHTKHRADNTNFRNIWFAVTKDIEETSYHKMIL